MVVNSAKRTMRRLTAAEGYLELGLPAEALDELQKVENPGLVEGPYMWLMGEALRHRGLYDEAIAPLRCAARAMPNGQPAWAALKECLEKSGRAATAEDMARTMEYLEQCSDSNSPQNTGMDPQLMVRIGMAQTGNLQINFDGKTGLTIKVNPPAGDET